MTIKAKSAAIAGQVQAELWKRGSVVGRDRLDATKVVEASRDAELAALAALGLDVDDGSLEARDPSVARASSLQNPLWWGFNEADINESNTHNPSESFGDRAPIGKLYWRYEDDYLCQVLLMPTASDEYYDVAYWDVIPADKGTATEYDWSISILSGAETGSYGDDLVDIVKAACTTAARSLSTVAKTA